MSTSTTVRPQKKILITQSNYIPWKGYFDSIQRVDEVILLDEVQFTKRDWRNRNQIKTPDGLLWLTIPVNASGRKPIWDIRVSDPSWGVTHWKSLKQNYCKSEYFHSLSGSLEKLYLDFDETRLSLINARFLLGIMDVLRIQTPIKWSHDYGQFEGKNQRLIDLCLKAGATDYYSGPAAKAYLDEDLFSESGIRVHWLDYSNYPVYPQLYGEFAHNVSVLDLIFNTGPKARHFMKY